MSYKARTFTREEFREVVAAAIYDYEQAPAKCLYTTKDAGDRLREYLDLTERENVTLDVDRILNTPINERYAHESHYHGLEYMEPHR